MALGMWPEDVLLETVRCKSSSQAGCADALRLRSVSVWIPAPPNAGVGLAFLIGEATGRSKCYVPESTLGLSGRARSDVSSIEFRNAPATVSQDVHRILACRMSGMLASATSGKT